RQRSVPARSMNESGSDCIHPAGARELCTDDSSTEAKSKDVFKSKTCDAICDFGSEAKMKRCAKVTSISGDLRSSHESSLVGQFAYCKTVTLDAVARLLDLRSIRSLVAIANGACTFDSLRRRRLATSSAGLKQGLCRDE